MASTVKIGEDTFPETDTIVTYRARESARSLEVLEKYVTDDAEELAEFMGAFVPDSAISRVLTEKSQSIKMTVTNAYYYSYTDYLRMTINYEARGNKTFQFDVEEWLERTGAELSLITYAPTSMSLRFSVPLEQ